MSQPSTKDSLPSDSQARKDLPVATGVVDYFPDALVQVAAVSKYGNDKHNPGQDLHWARGKSMDQADAIMRHLIDRGKIDRDTGLRHSAELAWRALANLQIELEEAGEAMMSRGSRLAEANAGIHPTGQRGTEPQNDAERSSSGQSSKSEPGEVPLMSMEHEQELSNLGGS